VAERPEHGNPTWLTYTDPCEARLRLFLGRDHRDGEETNERLVRALDPGDPVVPALPPFVGIRII